MTEAFLHYLFNTRKLGNHFVTTEGHALIVRDFGKLNFNAGPDFLESSIHFDNKTWAGHIEFHIKSSDWIKHKHQNDKAYDNVIAHFVWQHDREIVINNFTLPVVELKGLVDESEFIKYQKVLENKAWVACESSINNVKNRTVQNQIEDSSKSRLKRKSNDILQLIQQNRGDQLRTFLVLLAKSLGGKVNGDAMVKLTSKIEIDYFAKLDYNEFKVQALFHGLSGLLGDAKIENEYVLSLKNEFKYQQKLFGLNTLNSQEWKWSSMRPPGTPTIRIAQLAGIIANCKGDLTALDFEKIELDLFWESHYNFNAVTKKKSYQLGSDQINLIRINLLIPYQFAIARLKDNQTDDKKHLEALSQIKPENNQIIKHWKKIGIQINSALETQGLIEQKNRLCNEKKCLFCAIGQELLGQ